MLSIAAQLYQKYRLKRLTMCINQYTKFEMPSFTNSKDYDWGPKFNKNG